MKQSLRIVPRVVVDLSHLLSDCFLIFPALVPIQPAVKDVDIFLVDALKAMCCGDYPTRFAILWTNQTATAHRAIDDQKRKPRKTVYVCNFFSPDDLWVQKTPAHIDYVF